MKIKKFMSMIMVFALIVSTLLAGCGPAGMTNDDDPSDGRTRLYVSVYKAGEGIKWLEDIAAAYEKENENVKVVIYGDAQMEQVAQAAIEAGKGTADIYSSLDDGNYYQNVINGRLEPLNDLYDMLVDGTDKVKDIISADAVASTLYEGNYYAMPWHRQALGIIYNKTMFETKGWEVPTTMNEYYALCDQICRESEVYPFAYCGGITDGYFGEFVKSLMFQYGGKTSAEEFYAAESPEIYKQEGRLEAYKAVGRMIAGEGVDANGKTKTWALPGSKGFDHLQVAQEFIKGNCAMFLGGSWFPIENKEFLADYPNFNAAIMHTPWIQDDKISLDGGTQCANMTKVTRLVIPKAAENKEIAKDFLRFMNTKAMRKVFIEAMNGTPRPTTYDGVDLSGLDDFGRSVLDIVENDFFYNGVGMSEKFKNGDLSIILANNGEICSFFNNTVMSLSQIMSAAQGIVDADYSVAVQRFSI